MPDTTQGLAIVGPGLIGTSVALAARRRWPELHVRTIDKGQPLSAIGNALVIVLAAPVGAILNIIPSLPLVIAPEALVIDTGSTKHAIMTAAAAAEDPALCRRTPDGRRHERRRRAAGPLRWPPVVPDQSRRAGRRAAASRLVEALGARPVVLSDHGEEHDRLMAAVSQLPQVTATVLMAIVARAVGADNLQWAGSGLARHDPAGVKPGRRLAKRAGDQQARAEAADERPRFRARVARRSSRRSGSRSRDVRRSQPRQVGL